MNPVFNTKVGVKGFYKLEIRDNKGELRDTLEFENLITDNGLDLLATNSRFPEFCSVGSGSNVPTVSDTTLQLYVIGKRGNIPLISYYGYFNNQSYGGTPDHECICRGLYEFGEGEAQGNLSEIGIGPNINGTNLFSRALIRDINGNPTTITVLANEFLTVTYYLYVYPPLTDVVGSVSGYNYTLRASEVNAVGGGNGWTFAQNGAQGWNKLFFNLTGGSKQGAYGGAIGTITTSPASDGNSAFTDTRTNNAYTPGTYTRSGSFKFDISQANFNVRSFSFHFGVGKFQVEVDPVIPKKNTDELTIYVNVAWFRV